MFRPIEAYTLDQLMARGGARPLPVPAEFARCAGSLRGVPLVMTNSAYETERLRKVRVTYLDGGDAAQIMTTMAFPHTTYDLPIFAADMLSFRGAPHLIVIDHQVLFKADADYDRRYIAPLRPVYERYAHLPTRERTLPAWTEKFFSRYTHYSRPTVAYVPEVLAVYRDYWDIYLDHVAAAEPPPPERAPHVHAQQAAYCADHIANEQAEGMLQKLFGEAFYEAFVHRFLFDVHPAGIYS
ncbi:MAG: hypothetical protein GYB67_15380 [Chloroflexi bacterium]|nr:hypothetical protein [Chloroflexota bacterium]